MKTTPSTILCAAALCLLPSIPARAESPFYVRAAVGPGIADDITVKGDFNAPNSNVDYAASLSLAAGWQIRRWIGVELETGAVYMDLNRIYDDVNGVSAHATLIDVPLLANLVLRYERPEHRWSCYVKGGIGATAGAFLLSGSHPGVPRAQANDWDYVLAYKLGAGVGYRISRRWTVELGYEMFGTGSREWDVIWQADIPYRIGFDSVRVHSIQCAVRFNF